MRLCSFLGRERGGGGHRERERERERESGKDRQTDTYFRERERGGREGGSEGERGLGRSVGSKCKRVNIAA